MNLNVNKSSQAKLNTNNIFPLLKKHENHRSLMKENYTNDIEFVSTHFYELCEDNDTNFISLDIQTLIDILEHPKLRLRNEDQLVEFINRLFETDHKYSILYDSVIFLNVSSDQMSNFISTIEQDYITSDTWRHLCQRLSRNINYENDSKIKRYITIEKNFPYDRDHPFDGIINFLSKKSGNDIDQEIHFSSSSIINGDDTYHPRNVSIFNDNSKFFDSDNTKNNWICLKFKNCRVLPTNYTLRTGNWVEDDRHIKSWVVEGSEDDVDWFVLDEKCNCADLNGKNLCKTFDIGKERWRECKYVRIRSKGMNWMGDNCLLIEAFEIHGKIIENF